MKNFILIPAIIIVGLTALAYIIVILGAKPDPDEYADEYPYLNDKL